MKTSPKGLAFLESWEQLRLFAYQDQKGIWTIGWGHTGPEVVEGSMITREEAAALFAADIAWVESTINDLVKIPLAQNEFDALTSLVFNIGRTQFARSTLLRLLNKNDRQGAADQFAVFRLVKGQVNKGLVRRRSEERDIFSPRN